MGEISIGTTKCNNIICSCWFWWPWPWCKVMVGRQRQKFSVELFWQLSKQQALNLLQRWAIFVTWPSLCQHLCLDHFVCIVCYAFKNAVRKLWNNLPDSIRKVESVKGFRHLFICPWCGRHMRWVFWKELCMQCSAVKTGSRICQVDLNWFLCDLVCSFTQKIDRSLFFNAQSTANAKILSTYYMVWKLYVRCVLERNLCAL